MFGRANKKVLVIYNKNSNLLKTEKIENYYGFSDGISGKDLYNKGIEQAEKIGVQTAAEEVIKLEMVGEEYCIITNKDKYTSKAVIIAMGAKFGKLNIPGMDKFEGKGISYCAICDGFFYRGKDVVVIGSGDYAISEANDLINIAKKVTILTNGEKAPEFRAPNVEIITDPIKEISGSSKVEEIQLQNTHIKADGVFIANGSCGSIELAKKIGILTKDNSIVVDSNMKTNLGGIFACGDCTGGLFQVSKAVYEGTKAGLSAVEYLKNK